jgi:hypothetical protein
MAAGDVQCSGMQPELYNDAAILLQEHCNDIRDSVCGMRVADYHVSAAAVDHCRLYTDILGHQFYGVELLL